MRRSLFIKAFSEKRAFFQAFYGRFVPPQGGQHEKGFRDFCGRGKDILLE